jgi:hypothetical protein
MRRSARILALLVAVAAIMSSLAATTLEFTPHPLPVRCHEHGNKSPLPGSSDYTCCLTGHIEALPQELRFIAPSLQASIFEMTAKAPMTFAEPLPTRALVSTADPPGALSLRI